MKDWEKRRDKWLREVDMDDLEAAWNASRTDTLRELEPVIEALRFYADIGNWNYDQMMIREDYDGLLGCGKKARAVLALYSEAVGEHQNGN